jgi:hypothetical protein
VGGSDFSRGPPQAHMPSAGDAVRSAPKHGGRYPVRLLWCHRVNDGRLDDGWIIVTDAGAVKARRHGPFAQRGFRCRLERLRAKRPSGCHLLCSRVVQQKDAVFSAL